MDVATLFPSGLIVFGFAVHLLMKRFEKSARRFPWCKNCGKNMVKMQLADNLPAEIQTFLDKHKLPSIVVSKYVCPGCYRRLWFIPRFGEAEKGLFVTES